MVVGMRMAVGRAGLLLLVSATVMSEIGGGKRRKTAENGGGGGGGGGGYSGGDGGGNGGIRGGRGGGGGLAVARGAACNAEEMASPLAVFWFRLQKQLAALDHAPWIQGSWLWWPLEVASLEEGDVRSGRAVRAVARRSSGEWPCQSGGVLQCMARAQGGGGGRPDIESDL